MNEFIEKLIAELEKNRRKHTKLAEGQPRETLIRQQQFAGCFGKAIEVVKRIAEEYGESADCYKDCGQCEAYDKEKSHCPKFCKVINDTVAEIEENHSGWIPCSERLPDNFMSFEYLTIRKGHTLATITYYCVVNQKWYSNRNSTREIEVIAWQPLPAPYQPKGE